MSKRKYQILSVAVPRTLLEKIDAAIENGEYVSRSDFLRTAIKMLVNEHRN